MISFEITAGDSLIRRYDDPGNEKIAIGKEARVVSTSPAWRRRTACDLEMAEW